MRNGSGTQPGINHYAALKRLVKQSGLMEPQPAYYVGKVALTFGLLASSVALLLISDNLWIQLLNAAYLAFVFRPYQPSRTRLRAPAVFLQRFLEG